MSTDPELDEGRLVDRARTRHRDDCDDIIEGMSRFEPLNIAEWVAKVGDPATVRARILDTEDTGEHGDQGTLVILGESGGLVFTYVWDDDAQTKRWLSIRCMSEATPPPVQFPLRTD